MSGRTVLELHAVRVTRDGQAILDGIDLAVGAGENLTVLGPSGSGKTTLLRLCNRLDDPDAGAVLFQGRDVREWDPIELRRRVGLVSQTPTMFEGTVEENVRYGPGLVGRDCDPRALLGLVGLPAELLKRPAARLSVGQQQRVALARFLANEPELLLLDEPTSGLDVAAAGLVLELLVRLRHRLGLTVVYITHVLEQAAVFADRVALLHGRRIAWVEDRTAFQARDRAALQRLFGGG